MIDFATSLGEGRTIVSPIILEAISQIMIRHNMEINLLNIPFFNNKAFKSIDQNY